ncbi:MAG: PucR family transcriptional regulator ligand-binding domain-containing protein [Bacillota bacterium]|nr:PucR family transcriptional regulator ligand-binding domain-containing protein [Bacillota bacterium]MDW7730403.1 PucR family transcriptional regulator ligand-binding domain-containing protein [Bacillota bacterium]
MAITVRDALNIGGLVEATVIAGNAGLDNVIRAVDIIDVPDAAIWFRRDSLLSTTFYALKDSIDAQLQMLEDIKACGGAALIIFSPERYISHIDERLIQKADELSLPLLQMPDCSYIDVIVPVMSNILDKQVQALEYAQEVHAMMTNIVLKGKGLQELLTSLTTLLQYPVFMADANLMLLDAAIPPDFSKTLPPLLQKRQGSGKNLPLDSFYPEGLLTELLRNKKPSYYQHGSGEEDYLDFFFPVVAGETFYGVLIVPNLDGEFERSETVAMEAGAMAIALDVLKEKAIKETERKSELDFYNELLLGNIKNRENIISRARQFGLDATGSYFVILVELNKESIYYGRDMESGDVPGIEELEKRLYRLLHYLLEKEHTEGVVVEALGSLVMLIRIPDKINPDSFRDYGKNFLNKTKETIRSRMNGVPIYIAAGDYCPDIERISAGYIEAWETIDIGKKLYTTDFALAHSDMAPYHLVKRFLTTANTPKLYEQIYDPLIRYDREKGGELVQTLEAYVECNFSRTKTSEKLHIHRNSLNYRLQKIEKLLGQDVDKIDTFPLLLASISRRLST